MTEMTDEQAKRELVKIRNKMVASATSMMQYAELTYGNDHDDEGYKKIHYARMILSGVIPMPSEDE